MTDFKTIDAETLEYAVMELEASRKLGRVHIFIRNNRHRSAASIVDGVRLLSQEIDEYVLMNRIRAQQIGTWAGMLVSLRYYAHVCLSRKSLTHVAAPASSSSASLLKSRAS